MKQLIYCAVALLYLAPLASAWAFYFWPDPDRRTPENSPRYGTKIYNPSNNCFLLSPQLSNKPFSGLTITQFGPLDTDVDAQDSAWREPVRNIGFWKNNQCNGVADLILSFHNSPYTTQSFDFRELAAFFPELLPQGGDELVFKTWARLPPESYEVPGVFIAGDVALRNGLNNPSTPVKKDSYEILRNAITVTLSPTAPRGTPDTFGWTGEGYVKAPMLLIADKVMRNPPTTAFDVSTGSRNQPSGQQSQNLAPVPQNRNQPPVQRHIGTSAQMQRGSGPGLQQNMNISPNFPNIGTNQQTNPNQANNFPLDPVQQQQQWAMMAAYLRMQQMQQQAQSGMPSQPQSQQAQFPQPQPQYQLQPQYQYQSQPQPQNPSQYQYQSQPQSQYPTQSQYQPQSQPQPQVGLADGSNIPEGFEGWNREKVERALKDLQDKEKQTIAELKTRRQFQNRLKDYLAQQAVREIPRLDPQLGEQQQQQQIPAPPGVSADQFNVNPDGVQQPPSRNNDMVNRLSRAISTNPRLTATNSQVSSEDIQPINPQYVNQNPPPSGLYPPALNIPPTNIRPVTQIISPPNNQPGNQNIPPSNPVFQNQGQNNPFEGRQVRRGPGRPQGSKTNPEILQARRDQKTQRIRAFDEPVVENKATNPVFSVQPGANGRLILMRNPKTNQQSPAIYDQRQAPPTSPIDNPEDFLKNFRERLTQVRNENDAAARDDAIDRIRNSLIAREGLNDNPNAIPIESSESDDVQEIIKVEEIPQQQYQDEVDRFSNGILRAPAEEQLQFEVPNTNEPLTMADNVWFPPEVRAQIQEEEGDAQGGTGMEEEAPVEEQQQEQQVDIQLEAPLEAAAQEEVPVQQADGEIQVKEEWYDDDSNANSYFTDVYELYPEEFYGVKEEDGAL